MPTSRLMASGSATDVPPNFMTTVTTASPGRVGNNPPDPPDLPDLSDLLDPPDLPDLSDLLDPPDLPDLPDPPGRACSQQPLPMHQLGVQDGCPCGAANGVVPERDEFVVEHRAAAEPADGHRHAAIPIRVERRLRTIGLRQVHDWLRRRRWQTELLRPAAE